MSYFSFFKEIILHPISFLDVYFADKQVSKDLERMAFFFAWTVPMIGLFFLTTFQVI